MFPTTDELRTTVGNAPVTVDIPEIENVTNPPVVVVPEYTCIFGVYAELVADAELMAAA